MSVCTCHTADHSKRMVQKNPSLQQEIKSGTESLHTSGECRCPLIEDSCFTSALQTKASPCSNFLRHYTRGSSAKPTNSLVSAMRSRGDYYDDEDSYHGGEDYDAEDEEDEDEY